MLNPCLRVLVLLAALLLAPPLCAQSPMDGYQADSTAYHVWALALQPDGRLIVGGSFSEYDGLNRPRLVRLFHDGRLDAAFTPQIGDGEVRAILHLENGKILVAGSFTLVEGDQIGRLVRLNANGSRDYSFGLGANGTVETLAAEADGSILIGGSFTQIGGQPRQGLARLLANGSLDPSFQPDVQGTVHALAVQADGRIAVGGAFSHIVGEARSNLARLHRDGSIDTSITRQTNGAVFALALDVLGNLYVGGEFTSLPTVTPSGITLFRSRLARLRNSGSLDSSYDPGVGGVDSAKVTGLLLLRDGKLLVGGKFYSVADRGSPMLTRLLPDGSADAAFFSGLSLFADGLGTRALIELSDHRLLVGGGLSLMTPFPPDHRGLMRLQPNGGPEQFNLTSSLSDPAGTAVLQPGYRFLVGGSMQEKPLRAYTKRGESTQSFEAIADGAVHALAAQDDGAVVVGGAFSTFKGAARARLARLLSDGSLESGFDPGVNGNVLAIALEPDGSILIGGEFTLVSGQPRNRIARVLANGSLDTGFNPNVEGGAGGGQVTAVHSILVQTDGRILIGGRFTTVGGQPRSRLARLHRDGDTDASFTAAVNDGVVHVMGLSPEGNVLVGGSFTMVNAASRVRMAWLGADGTLLPTLFDAPNDTVDALALIANGQVIIGGRFTQVAGQDFVGLASYLPDSGTLDTGFQANIVGGGVRGLMPQSDGRLVVVGDFTTIAGQSNAHHLRRLSTRLPASQVLGLNGETARWLRGGSAPELARAPELLYSENGLNFSPLGPMAWDGSAWILEGVSVPADQAIWLRARGRVRSGNGNGSEGGIETTVMLVQRSDRIFANDFE